MELRRQMNLSLVEDQDNTLGGCSRVCDRIGAVPADSNARPDREELDRIVTRLNELNNTSSQILIFLSFAIVAGVTYLTPSLDPSRRAAISSALHWWTGAIFPTVIGIAPLKEINDHNLRFHRFVMWMRFALMWSGIVCIFIGAIYFFRAI
jgi:hypothetical protein